ncbi:MAG: hypothetical protein PHQ23_16770, partial [Candidatus Wallbacteria bacterium]|nr:hypothetical protein [Candidatus Wallbacteria bacterium]
MKRVPQQVNSPDFGKTFSREFDLGNALLLARASNLAYEDETKIRRQVTGEWGLADFRFFNKGDSQAFLAGSEKHLILAFRGTESKRDAVNDLDLIKV